jgi:hypothetical protein
VTIDSKCILWRNLALLAILIIASGCGLQRSPASDDAGWNPAVIDIHDQKHELFDDPACPAFVMIFIMHDCPISNSYIPELNRWHDRLGSHNIPLLLVHADPSITAEQARRHATAYKLTWPVILDPEQTWVQRAGATRVPEAVVFSRTEEILYRGRIDNRYAALGKRRAVTTSHDLHAALEAIVSGAPVVHPRTEAVGCFIPTTKHAEEESAGADEHGIP